MTRKIKRCSKCKQEKPLEDFHRRTGSGDGLQGACKACACAKSRAYFAANRNQALARQREYRAQNREKVSAQRRRRYVANRAKVRAQQQLWRENNSKKVREQQRRSSVRRKYGIALEVYDTHMALGCKICGACQDMHMDHDHSTGKLRGALCAACNKALGNMKDSPIRLEDAAAYLRAAA